MESKCFSENNLGSNAGPSIKKFSAFEVASDDDSSEDERRAPLKENLSPDNDSNTGDGDVDDEDSVKSLRDSIPKKEVMAAQDTSALADQETVTGETVEIQEPKHWEAKKAPRKVSSLTAMYEKSQRHAAATEERLKKLRSELEESSYAEYTFKPKISAKAQKIHHSTSDIIESVEKNRARLRQRLLDISSSEVYSFSPQICKRSSVIVEKNRAQGENDTSVVDRLYHSGVHPVVLEDPNPKKVRTQKEIDRHVSSLYQFEERKRNLLASLRHKLHEKEAASPSVNTREVVARLYTKKVTVDPTTVYKEVENDVSERCSSQNEKYLKSAKTRGLQKWFFHFSNMSNELSESDLDRYNGPYMDEKNKVHLLLQRHSKQTTWKSEEFMEILSTHEDPSFQLWKIRIRSLPEDSAGGETFKPKVDPVSSLLIERRNEGGRLSAHERLFLAARDSQLKEYQKTLEEQRQQLSEEAQRQEKQRKLFAVWRRISEKELLERKKPRETENPRYLEYANSLEALQNSTSSNLEKQTVDRPPSSVTRSAEESFNTREIPSCEAPKASIPLSDEKGKSVTSHDGSKEVSLTVPAASESEPFTMDSQMNSAIKELLKVISESPASMEEASCEALLIPTVNSAFNNEKHINSEASPEDSLIKEESRGDVSLEKEAKHPPSRRCCDQTEISDFFLHCSLCSGIQPISYSQSSLESKRKLKNLGKALYRRNRGL